MTNTIKKLLSKLKFKYALIGVAVVVVGLVVINALFRYVPPTTQQVRPGEQIVIEGVDQYSSFVKLEPDPNISNPEVTQLDLIVVYVEDFSALSQDEIQLLIFKARQAAGATAFNSRVMIKEYSDVDIPEDYADDIDPDTAIDPTNPSTYRLYGNLESDEVLQIVGGEPIEGISFADYVRLVKPATDDYEIYFIEGTKYLVVLKQAYSQAEFEAEVLVNFSDRGNYQFTYQDREQAKLTSP
ncbi:MAG: hypothetical protein JNK26_02610 [Candidatus Doudnabacteria bacterium]|nr:hypothetical protein [Candidatus Doudnabacteria bacterium]